MFLKDRRASDTGVTSASRFLFRTAVLSRRLLAIVESHRPELMALWQESWPRGGGHQAVNIAVEVAEVLCGEWLLCVCVFGRTRVCKSVRAGAGRWDPCDFQLGLGVTCILCVAIRRKEDRYCMSVCHASTTRMHLNSFLRSSPFSPLLSLAVSHPLSLWRFIIRLLSFRGTTLSPVFCFFSCLGGSFLSSVVCRGSMERHLLAPRHIPDYTAQLRL